MDLPLDAKTKSCPALCWKVLVQWDAPETCSLLLAKKAAGQSKHAGLRSVHVQDPRRSIRTPICSFFYKAGNEPWSLSQHIQGLQLGWPQSTCRKCLLLVELNGSFSFCLLPASLEQRGKAAVFFKLSISGNKHYVLLWSALPIVGN